MAGTAHLAMMALGIIAALQVYSLAQEQAMTRESVRPETAFIVLCNRVMGITVAVFVLWLNGKPLRPEQPVSSYAGISACSYVATSSQYEVLRFVTFPVQTLGKTAKVVPSMLLGLLFLDAKYTLRDWTMCLVVTASCFLFCVGKHWSVSIDSGTVGGFVLMSLYLLADAGMTTLQKVNVKKSSSQWNVMLYTNVTSIAIALVQLAFVAATSSGRVFVIFSAHTYGLVLALSVSSALSQLFIYETIDKHGPVALAYIMVIRQTLSVAVSSIFYEHNLSFFQWALIFIIAGVLLYEQNSKATGKRHGPSTHGGGFGESKDVEKGETDKRV